jgi:hypothetical protein
MTDDSRQVEQQLLQRLDDTTAEAESSGSRALR